jgi:hypothetical protein
MAHEKELTARASSIEKKTAVIAERDARVAELLATIAARYCLPYCTHSTLLMLRAIICPWCGS